MKNRMPSELMSYMFGIISNERRPSMKHLSRIIRTLLSLLVLLIVSLACGQSSQTSPTATPNESAWYACTLFVEKELKIPSRDAQNYNPGGVTALGNDQYKVEVYYAKYSDTYQCTVLHNSSDGNWQLLELNVKR
jgi:hypothetical protein